MTNIFAFIDILNANTTLAVVNFNILIILTRFYLINIKNQLNIIK